MRAISAAIQTYHHFIIMVIRSHVLEPKKEEVAIERVEKSLLPLPALE